MITEIELKENGFKLSEYNGDWVHDNYLGTGFSIEEGIVTWCRNGYNYHGLTIRITYIHQLLAFLTFLK